jgi:hypothetical protein
VSTDEQRFIGAYELIAIQQRDGAGQWHDEEPRSVGRIAYDGKGWVSVLIHRAERPQPSLPVTDPSLDAATLASLGRSTISYVGTYRVDPAGGRVTHHVELSFDPGLVGRDLVREYTFSDAQSEDVLTLGFRDSRLRWRRLG